ncbi:MAG: hypothetical protein CK425_03315 [Parachlamydia sp.]|nr:MAG: hypothetical protein CK425_03315 [Parachlamydia sp.]
MKKLAALMVLFVCAFTPLTHMNALIPRAVIDQTTGNGAAAWNFFDGTEFVIQASILKNGVWGTTTTISESLNTSMDPRVAINSNGNVAVIWQGNDPITGLTLLYGTTYNQSLATWASPAAITTTSENVLQDSYLVSISSADEVLVTYSATQILTSVNSIRAIFCPSYGTWAAPIALSP